MGRPASSQPHLGSLSSLAFLWCPREHPISSSLDMWRPFVALAQTLISSHFRLTALTRDHSLRPARLHASPVRSPTELATRGATAAAGCGFSTKLLIRSAQGSFILDNHRASPLSRRARWGYSHPAFCQAFHFQFGFHLVFPEP